MCLFTQGGSLEKVRRWICECVFPGDVGLNPAPFERLRSVVKEEVQEIGSLNGVAHLVLYDGICVSPPYPPPYHDPAAIPPKPHG